MEIKIRLELDPGYSSTARALDLAVGSPVPQFGDGLSPAQARRLSAALLVAADAVEAVAEAQSRVDAAMAAAPVDLLA